VITTPFSFIATTNAILLVGAKPAFIDIDPETYNMKPELMEAALTEHTKAILPVEAFGNTAHFDQYERMAQKHQIPLIEDSCEAIGAYLDGRPAGSFGMCSVFGFFPNKQVTTGEGGIILTDREDIREMCISLRNHGRDAYGRYVSLGYNYKMSEIAAALGYVQFQRLDELLLKRRQVAALYNTFLADVEEIHLPPNPCRDHSISASWFVYVVRLRDSFNQDDRDTVIKRLHSKDVGCSPYFPPIHLQKHIQERFGFRVGDFPECERVAQRTIALPFFTQLEEKDIKLVCQILKNCLASTSFTPKRFVI
jgi:perosamine synthetase